MVLDADRKICPPGSRFFILSQTSAQEWIFYTPLTPVKDLYTVNLEIYAMVSFSRKLRRCEFRENKPSRSGEITLSLYWCSSKSCPSREFLTRKICLLTLFAKFNSREIFRIYSILAHRIRVSEILSRNRYSYPGVASHVFSVHWLYQKSPKWS